MTGAIGVLKAIAALTAAILVGRWFLDEVQKAQRRKDAWYRPYLSPPGLLILAFMAIPIVMWILKH